MTNPGAGSGFVAPPLPPCSLASLASDPVLNWVRQNTYGHRALIPSPHGAQPRRYFDYTASGLPFRPIEELLAERVLPFMANTHTQSNFSGQFITALYEQAHDKVRRALRAGDDDIVIFTGSGATGAINKLITCLGLRIPDILQERFDCASTIPAHARPIVIRTRMEHHSNDIPWRETISDTDHIGYDADGRACWRDLDRLLSRPEYRDRPLKVGTFSAASNVTGVLNDTRTLARVMHDHGGYAFFDFAAAGPYVDIDMHPDDDPSYRKDAVFLSLHKFMGGPQTPGLLVANRRLFRTRVPAEPGGGTVLYTSPWEYRYLENLQHREESGTPAIVSVIRAGLAIDLKEMIGVDRLQSLENECVRAAATAWRGHPKIEILGPDPLQVPRLGILSLVLDNRQLHHNLAVRLLSDRYGIQVRGGCMCAGTYGHDLLDIDQATSQRIRDALDEGQAHIKPGWVRLSFGPAVSEEDLQVLIAAVPDIAENWRRYAVDYVLDPDTAEWQHRSQVGQISELSLLSPSPRSTLSRAAGG